MSEKSDYDLEELPDDEEDETGDEENVTEDGENPPEEGETEEEEEEKLGEEEHVVEEEPVILNSEDFISGPYLSENCTLPENIIEFDHSYGYDCKQFYNICLADERTIIFASGNLIHFFDIYERTLWFRRTAGGGGIGHIVKNPVLPHIAIGEKGDNPLLIIYEWPSLEIVSVLRDGTTRGYSHLGYSPDGALLCSQGMSPDYMLTIWNWAISRIMLRRKSYNLDVVNAMFSPFVPGQLSTSGAGHIKFWKMAQTFTGLKLIGELGRFGKTEMSDIFGLLPLPDEKVISGSKWGNMLLWEEGLIKVEVMRREREKCHTAPIMQLLFDLDTGELMTVALDGAVRVWYFDEIDMADPPEDDRVMELEPSSEYQVVGLGDRDAELMALVRLHPEQRDGLWLAQDGSGGIWQLELLAERREPVNDQILFCHAGPVVDMATSPCAPYLATIGVDGRIYMYNYVTKRLLVQKNYSAKGSSIVWLPVSVESTGTVLVAAFGDGVVRVLVASLHEREMSERSTSQFVTLIQVIKVHAAAITTMTLSPSGRLLVTGAEDSTIFIQAVQPTKEFVELTAIGYIQVPGPPTYIAWHPTRENVVAVCCQNGQLQEMELPTDIPPPTAISFELEDVEKKSLTFKSVKSQIRRDLLLEEIAKRKQLKVEKKLEELKKIKEENPGLDFDEETFLEDSEEEEELEPLHIPETPNPILFAIYTNWETLWLSMGGYDAGYVYEYNFETEGPFSSTIIAEGDDIEMNSHVYYHNGRYLFTGMQDGKVRVHRVNPEDFTDLSDFWMLPMHDNDNGIIRKMCFNHDQTYLFTCGNDCNVFAYRVNPEDDDYIKGVVDFEPSKGVPKCAVRDFDREGISLEEMKMRLDYERRMKIANHRKLMVKKALQTLGALYSKAVAKNAAMAPSQMYPKDEFVVDERINNDLSTMLADDMAMTKRKLEFIEEKSWLRLKKVRDFYIDNMDCMTLVLQGIDNPVQVTVFRERALTSEFFAAMHEVRVRIEDADLRNREVKREESKEVTEQLVRPVAQVPSFLKGINLYTPELKSNVKLQKLLARYLSKKYKHELRMFEWLLRDKGKPDPDLNHPDDVAAIEEARQTIGDYKLKTADDYSVPRRLRATTIKKYLELLETRAKLVGVKCDFNARVIKHRAVKLALTQRIAEQHAALARIGLVTGERKSRTPHPLPAIEWPVEFPEKQYEVTEEYIKSFVAAKPVAHSDRSKRRDNIFKQEKKPEKKPEPTTPLPARQPLSPGEEALLKQGQEALTDIAGAAQRSVLSLPWKPLMPMQALDMETLQHYAGSDASDTPWEEELKRMHLHALLYKQETIHAEIERSVRDFDREVEWLHDCRLAVEVDAKLLETHILKLNQELIVLKAFESREEFLTMVVVEKTEDDYRMKSTINGLNRDVEKRSRDIFNFSEREKMITSTFMEATIDNKFAVHLRKIFKKRYKPPKVEHGEDSESSSSEESSSSNEDDAASIDSRDIGPIKQDETVCPEGCDKDLFDLTFTMRAERHLVENKISDEKKTIEFLKKDIEVAMKKKRGSEAALAESQRVLEAFQREKQHKMNQVEAVVILKLSQMRHFLKDHKLVHLDEALVFSNSVQKKLLNRTAELDEETVQERERHKKNHSHMHDIKLESRRMLTDIRILKEQIVAEKIQKFGSVVDVRYLEESLLRRMIANMRGALDEYRRMQDKKAEAVKDQLRSVKDRLCCLIKENTEKLNMLLVLEKDTQRLTTMLKEQKHHMAAAATQPPYHNDAKMLKEMIRRQAQQIESLNHEMRCLKSKSRDDAGGFYVERPPKAPQLITIFRADNEIVTVTDDEITVREVPPEEEFTPLAEAVNEIPEYESKSEGVSELVRGLIQVAMIDHQDVETRTLVHGDEKVVLDIITSIIAKTGSLEVVPDEREEVRRILAELIDKLEIGSEADLTTTVIDQMDGELPADQLTVSELVLDVLNETIARVLPSEDQITLENLLLQGSVLSEDQVGAWNDDGPSGLKDDDNGVD